MLNLKKEFHRMTEIVFISSFESASVENIAYC